MAQLLVPILMQAGWRLRSGGAGKLGSGGGVGVAAGPQHSWEMRRVGQGGVVLVLSFCPTH